MKKQILLLVSLLLIACKSFSQEKIWQVKVFSFFDNIEFGGSGVKMPQTMSGIMVAPEAGLRWDSVHRISAGVNLMHEFGSGTATRFASAVSNTANNNNPVFIFITILSQLINFERNQSIFLITPYPIIFNT